MLLHTRLKRLKFFTAAFLLTMASALTAYADDVNRYSAAEDIRLVINGTELTGLPMSPVIYNDYTLVPAREVFETLGADVDWKDETREIYVGYGYRLLIMQVDNEYANVDGVELRMAIPPKVINDKTMIPLRFVSESFGFEVGWDPKTRVASVTQGAETPELDLAVQQAISGGAAGQTQPPAVEVPPAQNEITQMPPAATAQPAAGAAGAAIPAKDISTEKMTEVSAPQTKITGIAMPSDGAAGFTIKASSAISRVDKFLLPDNRLVLDFYNAEMALSKSEYTVGSGGVERIRAAQNQMEPVMVTRVVLEMTGGVEFRVSMAQDRQSVTVGFEKNAVTNITFSSDAGADTITLVFKNTPSAGVYPLINPDRLVIDAPNAVMEHIADRRESGRIVTGWRSEQSDAQTARVVLDTNGVASFTMTTQGNVMTVRVTEPTFRNIRYDRDSRTLRIAKSGVALTSGSWYGIDGYAELKYTIVMPGDYGYHVGYGDLTIHDGYLDGVLIRNNSDGNTELVISESRVLAYNITEDAQNVYIKAVTPKEKYPRVVVIDPGHGGTAPGTVQNGIIEKEVTLDIANRVVRLLEQNGSVKVYATRGTDVTVQLEDRPAFANSMGDLFVSIHVNSAKNNSTANGVETHYTPHANDGPVGMSTKRVAEIIQSSMISALGANDRKTVSGNLYVTKYTTMPSSLVEVGFASNPDEAAKLKTDDYKQRIAQAIYQAILTIFEQYTPAR